MRKWEWGTRIPSETGRASISTKDWGDSDERTQSSVGQGLRLSLVALSSAISWVHDLCWWSYVCGWGNTQGRSWAMSQNLYEGLWLGLGHFIARTWVQSLVGELNTTSHVVQPREKTKYTSRKSLSVLHRFWAKLILVMAESKLVWYCGLNCVTPKYMLK